MSRVLKRLLIVAAVVSAGGVAAVHPEVIKNFYEDVYPSDAAKRQALDLCFMQDHKFNRLESAEREACYRHALFVPPAEAAATAAGEAPAAVKYEPNAIDLRRAAGEGALPRNDARRREQTENALHPLR
jgi:hypothetical protein